jgi:hypothetical protein
MFNDKNGVQISRETVPFTKITTIKNGEHIQIQSSATRLGHNMKKKLFSDTMTVCIRP